jgi:hypothetical protein
MWELQTQSQKEALCGSQTWENQRCERLTLGQRLMTRMVGRQDVPTLTVLPEIHSTGWMQILNLKALRSRIQVQAIRKRMSLCVGLHFQTRISLAPMVQKFAKTSQVGLMVIIHVACLEDGLEFLEQAGCPESHRYASEILLRLMSSDVIAQRAARHAYTVQELMSNMVHA